MVHLSRGELNQLFDILGEWESILQAENFLTNDNPATDTSSPTSKPEVS